MQVYGKGFTEDRGKTWRNRIMVCKSPRKYVDFVKSKNEVTREEMQALLPIHREQVRAMADSYLEGRSKPLSKQLEDYVETCKASDLAVRTIESYEDVIRGYILPHFEGVTLGELDGKRLSEFFLKLKTQGGQTGTGLSVNTIKKVKYVLKAALDEAYADGLIQENPIGRARTYTGKRGAKRKDEEVAFTAEELAKLVTRAMRCPNRALGNAVAICGTLGLRRCEVLGLRWMDVSFEDKIIHIRHDLVVVRKSLSPDGNRMQLKGTKNDGSMRDVPMTDELASYLEEEKERQRRYAAFKGEELTDESPVVANKRGGFANPNTLSQMFKEFAIDTGVNPDGSFKSMRAGVASVLASQNVPMPDVARLLGHAEITTTARYYIKYVNDPAMRHVAETLRNALTA